jgi:hypothetical protein
VDQITVRNFALLRTGFQPEDGEKQNYSNKFRSFEPTTATWNETHFNSTAQTGQSTVFTATQETTHHWW